MLAQGLVYPTGLESRSPRKRRLQRAKVVCQDCHSRKVKCDLSLKEKGQPCSNCSAEDVQCMARQSNRKRRADLLSAGGDPPDHQTGEPSNSLQTFPFGYHTPPQDLSPNQGDGTSQNAGPAREILLAQTQSNEPPRLRSPPPQYGYLGGHSFLDHPNRNFGASQLTSEVDYEATYLARAIQEAKSLTSLPPRHVGEALIEKFFTYASPYYPIVDRETFHPYESSRTLHNAIFLAGSQMGSVRDDHDPIHSTPNDYYRRTKALIHMNAERDPVTLLKSICLMTWWAGRANDVRGLDTTWHWTGVGVKLAILLGLHRERPYSKWEDAGCRRRIWWHLVASDRIQSACFGRPQLIDLAEVDTRPLSRADFPESYTEQWADAYLVHIRLYLIIGRISKARSVASTGASSLVSTEEQNLAFALELQDWIDTLPSTVRLFRADGMRNNYSLPVMQLHLAYLAAVAYLSLSLPRSSMGSNEVPNDRNIPTTRPEGIIAASCLARLFEEILVRDDLRFLPSIVNWFMLLSAIPLLCCFETEQNHHKVTAQTQAKASTNHQTESMLELRGLRRVLQRLAPKWPASRYMEKRIAQILEQILTLINTDPVAGASDEQNNRSQTSNCSNGNERDHQTSQNIEAAASRRQSDSHALTQNRTPASATRETAAPQINIAKFFPFQPSLCPRLRWLDAQVLVDEYVPLLPCNQVPAPPTRLRRPGTGQEQQHLFNAGSAVFPSHNAGQTTFPVDADGGAGGSGATIFDLATLGANPERIGPRDLETFYFADLWPGWFDCEGGIGTQGMDFGVGGDGMYSDFHI